MDLENISPDGWAKTHGAETTNNATVKLTTFFKNLSFIFIASFHYFRHNDYSKSSLLHQKHLYCGIKINF